MRRIIPGLSEFRVEFETPELVAIAISAPQGAEVVGFVAGNLTPSAWRTHAEALEDP
jgi:hypothetical protein